MQKRSHERIAFFQKKRATIFTAITSTSFRSKTSSKSHLPLGVRLKKCVQTAMRVHTFFKKCEHTTFVSIASTLFWTKKIIQSWKVEHNLPFTPLVEWRIYSCFIILKWKCSFEYITIILLTIYFPLIILYKFEKHLLNIYVPFLFLC